MRHRWREEQRHRWVDGCEGVQDKSCQNMPFWYEGYFELKVIKTPWAQEKFCPFPKYLEEPKLGIFARLRVIIRDTVYVNDPSLWQGKHLISKRLFSFSRPCELPSSTLKPGPPSQSVAQDGINTSFYPSVLGPLLWVVVPIQTKLICFSSVDLSCVHFILRPPGRTFAG